MKIFAEVTIDETGIIEQMDKVKNIGTQLENEMLILYGMLTAGKAEGRAVKENYNAAKELKYESCTTSST